MRLSFYSLCGGAVSLGAFLLFAIQPIAGKQLLPFFGGSSSVWATSLLFFTGMLFLGYLYVYVLTRLPRKRQSLVHLVLVGIAVAIALAVFFSSQGTFFFAGAGSAPALGVLSALFFSIGAPYFLLSTTGPLMQYWYGTSTDPGTGAGYEPYALYALSNAASFLALLSYPFLIEPFISLRYQRGALVVLFLGYAFVCAASATTFFFARRSLSEAQEISPTSLRPTHAERVNGLRESVLWIMLAALPSFTLVATTTQITQTIAPVPLLWIVPLALYLVTFIIAFRGWGQSIFTPLLFFASAVAAWWFTPAAYDDIMPQVLSYLALLFFCGLSCHVLLYRMRPTASSSPLFYVLLSLGGAIGVLAASVLAPLVFSDYWEFPLALALAAALAAWILPKAFFPRILDSRHIVIARILFLLLAVSLFMRVVLSDDGTPTISERNFYGNTKVFFESHMISLMHGTTLHGTQFADSADARLSTTYFTPGSGIGRTILYQQDAREENGINVGVVGLGTGTIAAYCRPGDTYVFYEIDSRIERIARSYFSYLSHCDGSDVRIGDGRVVLEEERTSGALGAYDVLAVDAFSDDTIPVHLLTLQAFELYSAHLRGAESMLAIHISNRYLNLAPVVFRLAAELGFNAILVSDSGESSPGGSASSWVVLSKDPDAFTSVAFANTNSSPPEASAHVWTDDYSSLLPVLDIPRPWD